jgi:ketosteroid isomerase-like protein
MVARSQVTSWITDYERAWRTPGTASLRDLFADDASYQQTPYDVPILGLIDIASMWEEEREGPDEVFTVTSEVVAVEGDTAVVRVQVEYGEPVTQEYLDLWVIRFDADGRCVSFEEWPFWPEQGSSPS